MSNTISYKKIYEQLLQAQKVFIVSHPGCGDALGSCLAVAHWLRREGVAYDVYSNDIIPEMLTFLPRSFEILTPPNLPDLHQYDVILIVDANKYMTGLQKELEEKIDTSETTIINIDHHITNKNGDGDISVVDTKAPSTTFMLNEFFTVNKCVVSREMATCLLVGILFDTGNFSNSATNPQALAAASQLMAVGVPFGAITKALIQNKTIPLLRLWGNVLSRLSHNTKYDIVYTVIGAGDVVGNMSPSTGQIANFLNDISEGSFSMIFKQAEADLIKVSLRTTYDTVNVAKFAQYFGGGGHTKAAGFALKGRLVYNDRTGNFRIE